MPSLAFSLLGKGVDLLAAAAAAVIDPVDADHQGPLRLADLLHIEIVVVVGRR